MTMRCSTSSSTHKESSGVDFKHQMRKVHIGIQLAEFFVKDIQYNVPRSVIKDCFIVDQKDFQIHKHFVQNSVIRVFKSSKETSSFCFNIVPEPVDHNSFLLNSNKSLHLFFISTNRFFPKHCVPNSLSFLSHRT
jgi:hypothetical protein